MAFEEIKETGGVYVFPDASGGTYGGQSGNLHDRLRYWIRNGRVGGDIVVFPLRNAETLIREIFEQGTINGLG
ncbi:hypothetical protein ABTM48_21200, partial [Acinetobacter baumannii]